MWSKAENAWSSNDKNTKHRSSAATRFLASAVLWNRWVYIQPICSQITKFPQASPRSYKRVPVTLISLWGRSSDFWQKVSWHNAASLRRQSAQERKPRLIPDKGARVLVRVQLCGGQTTHARNDDVCVCNLTGPIPRKLLFFESRFFFSNSFHLIMDQPASCEVLMIIPTTKNFIIK